MATLVWLTKTVTGDFDELNLLRLDHPFFQDCGHRGTVLLDSENPFYPHDFLRFLHKRMSQSNLLIVNHAFLARESLRERPQLPKSRFLLIDEAHHLPDICEQAGRQQVSTFRFRKQVGGLTSETGLFTQLMQLFQGEPQFISQLELYLQELTALVEMQEILVTHLLKTEGTDCPQEQIVTKKSWTALI